MITKEQFKEAWKNFDVNDEVAENVVVDVKDIFIANIANYLFDKEVSDREPRDGDMDIYRRYYDDVQSFLDTL